MRDNSPIFHWVILVLFVLGVGWLTFLVDPRSDTQHFHPGVQTIPERVIEKKLIVPESSAPPQAVPDATPQAVPETQSWQ